MKKIFLLLFFAIFLNDSFSQKVKISGKVLDNQSETLPYASVHINGTTNGTVTNIKGEFSISVKEFSEIELVFQYVGFKKKLLKLNRNEKLTNLVLKMESEEVNLTEIVVKAGEDPAYPIVRNAIKNRKTHLEIVNSFSTNIYSKGGMRLNEIPKKFPPFISKKDLPDSNDLQLLSMQELLVKYHFQKPDNYKEEVLAEKKTGAGMISMANSARQLFVNFYENLISTGIDARGFYSPISTNATFYYKFRLINKFNEGNKTICKIKVMPKRVIDPTFDGYIYLFEENGMIHSLDLTIPKTAEMYLLDSLNIKQNYEVLSDSISIPLFVKMRYYLKLLGFGITGEVYGHFSDYEINKNFSKNFFNNEVLKVDKDYEKSDSSFWKDKRKTVLTEEETKLYQKDDSIMKIISSKAYIDSVDKVRNRFSFSKVLLFGYDYKISQNNLICELGTIWNLIDFNSVEGFSLQFAPTIRKQPNFDGYIFGVPDKFSISPEIKYSFAAKKFYEKLTLNFHTNYINSTKFSLSAGQTATQFNPAAINKYINIFYSLFLKRNYAKFFEKTFVALNFEREIVNGIYFFAQSEYSKREMLQNATNYSFFYREKEYYPNAPVNNLVFDSHNALIFEANLLIRFRQKYFSYPNYKRVMESDYPELSVNYKKAVKISDKSADFDFVEIILADDIDLKNFGTSNYQINVGKFLSKKTLYFVDYKHFNGCQTELTDFAMNSFETLKYYESSTNLPFFEVHFSHNFNRWLINKLPLIRKTKFDTVAGINFLYTDDKKDFTEIFFGLDKMFGFLRVDVAGQYSTSSGFSPQIRFGVNLLSGIKISSKG